MKIIFALVLVTAGFAANAQSTPADIIADKIAQKMKDSLSLSASQKLEIYQINLQLHEHKLSKRAQYAGTDSAGVHVQRVENTRDLLYRPVLGENKYQLYLQKKRNLLSIQ